ncbi:sigma-70 family RNA polymerase sigma factor [Deinococcus detaillensis]|uniref:Sigma-70 family RNA polymerase sigma factor n=1 Tax=Deinococcus detaillensis TaxID=2592048 RepID=A0A553V3X5_9DEIO|nr:sigma-70 family RNA polymerase sigma factor [Deinococcus detaillensis]TSA87198.1 sigma-70 family RNA polymerase sigma factor [Deinococcus detaillensis]
MDDYTDEQLIRLAHSDTAAFETLLRRHAAAVHRLAASVVGSSSADDVVQEVFVSVHKNLGSFRGDAKFSTWLHRITLNACSAALRKKQPDALDDWPEPAAHHDPARSTEQAQLRELLAWAMQQLPEGVREAVTLRELAGLDYSEIAEVLGVELGTVKSRISRGRATLRELIKGRWDVPQSAKHPTPKQGVKP